MGPRYEKDYLCAIWNSDGPIQFRDFPSGCYFDESIQEYHRWRPFQLGYQTSYWD